MVLVVYRGQGHKAVWLAAAMRVVVRLESLAVRCPSFPTVADARRCHKARTGRREQQSRITLAML